MSGLPGLVPVLATLVQATLLLPIRQPFVQRYFQPSTDQGITTAPFPTATVWIEEQHEDTMTITDHPVESGSPITDHAFARPVSVTIRLGWSGEEMPQIQQTYQQLVDLKNAREIFDIQTGKRLYKSMLIENMQVMTEQRSAFVLLATIRCRQVILVNVGIVPVPASTGNQAIPSSTAPATNSGTTTVTPGSSFNPAGVPPDKSWLISPGTPAGPGG
jgi:hypothetical protein